jgi:hypothetical protein
MAKTHLLKLVRVVLILAAFVLLCGFKDCSKKPLIVIRYRPIVNFKKYVPSGRFSGDAFVSPSPQMMMMYQIIAIENNDPGAVPFTFRMANVYADDAVMLTGARPLANSFPDPDDSEYFASQRFKETIGSGEIRAHDQSITQRRDHLIFVFSLKELGAGEENYPSHLEYKEPPIRNEAGLIVKPTYMVLMVQDPVSTCVCYQDMVFMSSLVADNFKVPCKITNKKMCERCFTPAECQNCSPSDACTVAIKPKFVPPPPPPPPPLDDCISAPTQYFCLSVEVEHKHQFYDAARAANEGEALCAMKKKWPSPKYTVVHAESRNCTGLSISSPSRDDVTITSLR